ncbi:MAG: DUF5011 domain-containing protein [Oscillospiraceae bacterium]|nr:DUF5011 domain-containing protein [Oscillospiraceae bacterium]
MKFVSSRGSRNSEGTKDKNVSSAQNLPVQPVRYNSHVQVIDPPQPQVQVQEQTPPSKTYFAEYTRMTLTPEQQTALERVAQKAAAQRAEEQQDRTQQRTQPLTRQRIAKQRADFRRNQNASLSGKSKSRQKPNVQKKPGSKAKNIAIILLSFLVVSIASFIGWYYWWTEYATFDYELLPVVVLQGQNVNANEFLYPNDNMSRISATYRNSGFISTPGQQEVNITLTRGWRTVDAVATLHILAALSRLDVEFAEAAPELKPIDLIANPSDAAGVPFNVSFTEPPLALNEYSVGVHALRLELNNAPFEVPLNVVDTTPPAARALSIERIAGDTVSPEDFVDDVFDASGNVTIEYYDKEPNMKVGYNQIIEILLTDIYGNSTVINSELTVKLNQSKPIIEGAEDIVHFVGSSIIYSRGLTATDDFGRDLTDEIVIDSSGVDLNTVGVYTVRFSVTDMSGLKSDVIEVEVHVLDIDIDYVYQRVDAALQSIFWNGMTQRQQVQAIFNFVKNTITYAPAGRPATAEEGAYRALIDRRGNCYNYYSLSAVMLDRAGIPNQRIERIPGTPTRHRWNLVNPDDLGWHHYDSVPNNLGYGRNLAFFTETQAEEVTRLKAELTGIHNYYTYNKADYPEVVR